MPDDPLMPADRSEVLFNLSFVLTNNGKRKFDHGRTFMAQITAEHLLAHLERSGYVIMQGPGAQEASYADRTINFGC